MAFCGGEDAERAQPSAFTEIGHGNVGSHDGDTAVRTRRAPLWCRECDRQLGATDRPSGCDQAPRRWRSRDETKKGLIGLLNLNRAAWSKLSSSICSRR